MEVVVYSDREIGRMADRHNDRLLNEHLDKEAAAEIREEYIAQRVEEVFPGEMVDWFTEQGANAVYEVITESVAVMDGRNLKADETLASLMIAVFKGDKTRITRALIGDAFVEWVEQYGRYALEDRIRDAVESDL